MFNLKNNPSLINNQNTKIIFIRHAEKEPLIEGQADFQRGLTQQGEIETQQFAKTLAALSLPINKIISSPVRRCQQTAIIIQQTLNINNLEYCSLLGNPGAYVNDDKLAAHTFAQWSVADIIHKLWQGETLAGLSSLKQGTQSILQKMQLDLQQYNGTLIYVSHDAIMAAFISAFLSHPLTEDNWMNYLQGFIVELTATQQTHVILAQQKILIDNNTAEADRESLW